MLSENGNPYLLSARKLLDTLGLQLSMSPKVA